MSPTGPSLDRRDWLTLAGLLVLAAVLRLVDIAGRGTWDADQGHDMLVLRALVTEGTIPLLGPPTSLGDIHHGALYYYLLAPAAFLSGADPVAVTAWIAILGVVAVGVTWWLARAIGGRLAGLIAGLVIAVSASAIEQSTFIWNPNLIPAASAIAFAGAWQARQTGRARWWLVAAAGAAVTVQCHVLGIVLLPAIGAFYVATWRATPIAQRRPLAKAGLAAAGLIALSFLPLAIHELTHDFSETRNALAYLAGDRPPVADGPLERLWVIGLRLVAWPLTGLITNAATLAVLATAGVIVLAAWRFRAGGPQERLAVAWLGLTVIWSAVALTFLAPDLATVIPGLPNDHYHAFIDPAIAVLTGLGLAGLARLGSPRWHLLPAILGFSPPPSATETAPSMPAAPSAPAAPNLPVTDFRPVEWIGPATAALVLGGLIAWNVATWPPRVASDGGWPAAEAVSVRIGAAIGVRPFALIGQPDFKPIDAYGFPLVRQGLEPGPLETAEVVVVACDRLFEATYGGPCGGPAEEALGLTPEYTMVDRFPASVRTVISIYRAAQSG